MLGRGGSITVSKQTQQNCLSEQTISKAFMPFQDMVGKSQYHSMVGVGRDLCGSSSPTPLPKQGHPEQAAQDHIQAGLEYLQRSRLHNLPGQPGPGLRHPQREEVLPHVQTELPVPQLVSSQARLGASLIERAVSFWLSFRKGPLGSSVFSVTNFRLHVWRAGRCLSCGGALHGTGRVWIAGVRWGRPCVPLEFLVPFNPQLCHVRCENIQKCQIQLFPALLFSLSLRGSLLLLLFKPSVNAPGAHRTATGAQSSEWSTSCVEQNRYLLSLRLHQHRADTRLSLERNNWKSAHISNHQCVLGKTRGVEISLSKLSKCPELCMAQKMGLDLRICSQQHHRRAGKRRLQGTGVRDNGFFYFHPTLLHDV